jgi:hypothetical protein
MDVSLGVSGQFHVTKEIIAQKLVQSHKQHARWGIIVHLQEKKFHVQPEHTRVLLE